MGDTLYEYQFVYLGVEYFKFHIDSYYSPRAKSLYSHYNLYENISLSHYS